MTCQVRYETPSEDGEDLILESGEFGKEGAGLNFAHCQIRNYVKDGGQMNTHRCNMIRLHHLPKFVGKSYNASRNILIVAEDLDRRTVDYQRMQYYLVSAGQV